MFNEKQISYDITYMWNLKKGTNKLICRTKKKRKIIRLNGGSRRGKRNLINIASK